MRENLVVITVFVLLFGLVILSPYVEQGKMEKHCSLTGTYVIDNGTVIVCRVVKRGEAQPSEPPKKGELSL